MRLMGIDFGAKRVGIAISDEEGNFSFPHSVLSNDNSLLEKIGKLCEENRIGEIVVGESKDFKGNENEIMKEVRPFIESLKKFEIPIKMHPEFMTSAEAEHIQGKNEMHDASAAALILKSYLETNKNK